MSLQEKFGWWWSRRQHYLILFVITWQTWVLAIWWWWSPAIILSRRHWVTAIISRLKRKYLIAVGWMLQQEQLPCVYLCRACEACFISGCTVWISFVLSYSVVPISRAWSSPEVQKCLSNNHRSRNLRTPYHFWQLSKNLYSGAQNSCRILNNISRLDWFLQPKLYSHCCGKLHGRKF